MLSAIFTIATLAIAAIAKDVTVNTPKAVIQCQEVTLTWQDGKAPYNISVVPGDDPCDDALIELPQTNDTWYHWTNPSIAPGTKIIIAIEDATGEEAWSGELTVQKGNTTTCPTAPSSSSTPSSPVSGTTLAVPPAATNTYTNPQSGSGNTPVANPGSAIGAAPSSKGGLMAVGAGLLAVASIVVVF